jgi:hypothetical protein
MERGSRTLQDEYKKGSLRAKENRSIVFVELCCRLCRIRSL